MVRRLPILIILLVACIFASEKILAQRILGAFSVGMNLTQVDGDLYYGFNKVGLNVGPEVIIPFGKSKNWSVSMELLYSQKGSHHGGGTDSTGYNLALDYAEIPVLVHYTDKKLISGGVGFSYGRLINYKETENNFFKRIYTQESLSINDISVIADVQIRIWNKLWAGLRYQYSVKSNRTVDVHNIYVTPTLYLTRYQYNNVITIRATWVFNQEKIVKGRPQTNSDQQ